MGKPSAPEIPAPPDPRVLAQAQADANSQAIHDSAAVSQINQVTPFGNVTFSGEIGSPDRTVTTTLSPSQESILRAQDNTGVALSRLGVNLADDVRGVIKDPYTLDPSGRPVAPDFGPGISAPTLDPSGRPTAPTSVNPNLPGLTQDFSTDRQRVEESVFNRGIELLGDQFDRREKQVMTQLRNQGLVPGSEAFDDAYNLRVADPRREAELALALDSVRAGGDEQSRITGLNLATRGQGVGEDALLFNQSLQARQLGTGEDALGFGMESQARAQNVGEEVQQFNLEQQARNSGINEDLLQRTNAINELSAILQGRPALNVPAVQNTGTFQVAPPDIIGANQLQQQNAMANANLASQQQSGFLGGLFQLGSAALPLFI